MSLKYLPEYVENALLTLEIATKEAKYLAYTRRTLYAQSIDLGWVKRLAEDENKSEKIDAFVGRFSRLQDHIGEKLIPRFAALLGVFPKSLLDVLDYAEKMVWLDSAEAFVNARKLRNLLVHEYMNDPEVFLKSLQAADGAAQMLIDIVTRLTQYAHQLGLKK